MVNKGMMMTKMTTKNSNLDEVILNDTTVGSNRGRRSDLFHKRFRQSFKDHKRYDKADRRANKNCHKELS